MNTETQRKGNSINIQIVHPTRGHASNGSTGPRQYQKVTKNGIAASNKADKEKNVQKTKGEDMRRCQSTKVLHT